MYNNKRVAIIGMSVEGLDSAKFFYQEHAHITLCDMRTKEELGEGYWDFSKLGDFQLGSLYLSNLLSYDLIVRTPGMSPRIPQLKEAAARGITVTSQTRLFFEHCQAPIIGVTGTKGKGTTSTLIYQIIKKAGKTAWLGGNVGVPLLSKVRDIQPQDLVVLELSSFQLEDQTASPHIAVVLKITQDHLKNSDPLATNYHPTIEAYREAKMSIVRYQGASDIVIASADDAVSSRFAQESKAMKYYFGSRSQTADCFIRDNAVVLRVGNQEVEICRSNDIQLRGLHNLENIAAATLAARALDISIPDIRQSVREFTGLPHRLECIRKVGGVSYFNDSFSTVSETAIAAIRSFHEPLTLIVGGADKGASYEDLASEIARSQVRALIIIGAMTDRILSAVRKTAYSGVVITGLTTMNDIVQEAAKRSEPGSVVLLSPACASFDMFANYKDRGEKFRHEVEQL